MPPPVNTKLIARIRIADAQAEYKDKELVFKDKVKDGFLTDEDEVGITRSYQFTAEDLGLLTRSSKMFFDILEVRTLNALCASRIPGETHIALIDDDANPDQIPAKFAKYQVTLKAVPPAGKTPGFTVMRSGLFGDLFSYGGFDNDIPFGQNQGSGACSFNEGIVRILNSKDPDPTKDDKVIWVQKDYQGLRAFLLNLTNGSMTPATLPAQVTAPAKK